MATENDEILAKISQLAGQINKHKNPQPPPPASSNYYAQHQPTGPHGSSAYPRPNTGWRGGRGGHAVRGYRGGKPSATHRHKTLILNGATATPNPDALEKENVMDSSTTAASGSSWVTKQDRHLQLINTSIYEKESQTRAKALEETRKQKILERDAREKHKFAKHLQRVVGNAFGPGAAQPRSVNAHTKYEINVQGIQFQVVKNGSKLKKISGEGPPILIAYEHGDVNDAKATPKIAMVGGVRFYRSKNGNMYRSGIIKAYRKSGVIKKINEPCKIFTTTGSCGKGPRCRYVHDPTKTAVCLEFLSKGSCPSGESCDLSHDLTPERTPACLHFARGNCSKPHCRYTHVRVSPTAPVCRAFGIYSYCDKGSSCAERHVHECPDFSNTGTCATKGCKLPHKYKASVMRGNPNREETPGEGDASSDLSSDDDEAEIDSDDVDSDDLDEEYFGNEHTPDVDAMRKDYVQLS